MFQLFIFFHGKRDGKKQVLYNVKKAVNSPISLVFLPGERGVVYEQKERRREIDQQGDNDPEFLGIIDVKDGGVRNLLIQEENAVKDQEARLQ
jgi:hypothetical protein